MAIVTKRNAVIGWITLKFGKKVGKRVARSEARELRQKVRKKLRVGRKH